MRAVGQPRVVGAGAVVAQPSALEQRADDVAAVAKHVDEPRLRERAHDGRREERRLGRLLDAAQAADEADRARDAEHAAQASGRVVHREICQLGDRRLHGRDLAEVDEARHAPDRAGEERGAGARAAEHEDEPVVRRAERLAQRTRAGEPLRGLQVEHGAVHAASLGGSGETQSVSVAARCSSRYVVLGRPDRAQLSRLPAS